jgi:hypothetical protein
MDDGDITRSRLGTAGVDPSGDVAAAAAAANACAVGDCRSVVVSMTTKPSPDEYRLGPDDTVANDTACRSPLPSLLVVGERVACSAITGVGDGVEEGKGEVALTDESVPLISLLLVVTVAAAEEEVGGASTGISSGDSAEMTIDEVAAPSIAGSTIGATGGCCKSLI